jgi:hypothetical protein
LRLTGFNTDRGFGIEIECLWPSAWRGSWNVKAERLASLLRAAGVEAQNANYSHATVSHWKIVSDGSVSNGCEVVSPPMRSGLDSLAELRKVGAVLTAAHFKIDRSCGLHIHHEARDLDAKAASNLARLVNRFQPILNGLMPLSRRGAGSQYTAPFSAEELGLFEKATVACCGLGRWGRERDYSACTVATRRRGGDRWSVSAYRGLCVACASETRYKALNIRSLHQHGTVEFRQHSGTVEGDKIINWLLLTQGLVEKAKAGGRSRRKSFEKLNGDGLKNLLRASGLQNCKPHGQEVDPQFKDLTKGACRYWRKRAKSFGVLDLGDNSAARSRAGTTSTRQLTPRERVAAAAGLTTTTQSAS